MRKIIKALSKKNPTLACKVLAVAKYVKADVNAEVEKAIKHIAIVLVDEVASDISKEPAYKNYYTPAVKKQYVEQVIKALRKQIDIDSIVVDILYKDIELD